mmetsp:Transcript_14525/g.36495  ORF Transcript_14525/g.36495 Transcript_14525/m.36495 type:complete len:249 (-) Transcript_14525:77-823(-)
MFRPSYLTIALILVAACFDPVVSQTPSSAARKYTKSPSYAPQKCTKNGKASCIRIVLDDFQLDNQGRVVSYGNGPKDSSTNPIKTKPIAEGTQWIRKGAVEDDIGFNNPDYYFYIQCTVLEGKIKYSQDYNVRLMENEKLTCNIDICVGVGHSEVDVPDCVFLKGLTNFDIKVKTDLPKNAEGSWYLAVIGGLGRFTGSVGLAEYIPAQPMVVGDKPSVELDATISPYYAVEKVVVPLPPRLDTSMVP